MQTGLDAVVVCEKKIRIILPKEFQMGFIITSDGDNKKEKEIKC